MRLLLDETLDWRLNRLFSEAFEATNVRQRGWSSKKNGELLRLAQHEFDAFLMMDRGIEHQQNLEGLDLAIVLMRAKSNRIEAIAPLMDEVEETLPIARPARVPKNL